MSNIFDTDRKGQRALDERARANPLDIHAILNPDPGFFTGAVGATGMGFLRGGAQSVQTLSDTASALMSTPGDFSRELDILGNTRLTAEQKQHQLDELNVGASTINDVVQDAVDYWTPDPGSVGTAGQVLGSFAEIGLPLMVTAGNPALMTGNAVESTTRELERQGVDPTTAGRGGVIAGAATLAGFKIPILGKNLASRLATGAAGNVLFGAGAEGGQALNLQASGYDEVADQYHPANVEGRVVDLLSGLVFGGMHHLGHLPTRVKDAALTESNAEHFRQSSLPDYDQADPGAQARGQHALDDAMRQMLNGDPVDVAGRLKPGDHARIERAVLGRTGYAEGIEPRMEGENDKAYAKRVVDHLPAPKPAQLPDEPARYFQDVDASPLVPLGDLVSAKSASENAKGGTNGLKRMAAAADGVLGRREPISVRDNGDGTYTVLDGNGTLTAARKAGFKALPVRVTEVRGVSHEGLQARYHAAAKVLPKFRTLAREIADTVGARAILPGLKGAGRALGKVEGDYRGDAGKIKDLVRGTLSVDRLADTGRAIEALREKFGEPVGRVRNSLDADAAPLDASGYRDFKATYRIDGEPVEMQVSVPEMLRAKKQVHDLYEQRDAISRKAKDEKRLITPEESDRIDALNQEMAEAFEAAWATALRNSASETSTPSSYNRVSESGTPSPDDQLRTAYRGSSDQGSPSTSTNRVPGGKDLGSEGDLRASGMRNTSDASIPKAGADNANQVTPEASAEQAAQAAQAAAEAMATDVIAAHPDLEVKLEDGTITTAREAMEQADADFQQAQQDAKGFGAAIACALRNLA